MQKNITLILCDRLVTFRNIRAEVNNSQLEYLFQPNNSDNCLSAMYLIEEADEECLRSTLIKLKKLGADIKNDILENLFDDDENTFIAGEIYFPCNQLIALLDNSQIIARHVRNCDEFELIID